MKGTSIPCTEIVKFFQPRAFSWRRRIEERQTDALIIMKAIKKNTAIRKRLTADNLFQNQQIRAASNIPTPANKNGREIIYWNNPS